MNFLKGARKAVTNAASNVVGTVTGTVTGNDTTSRLYGDESLWWVFNEKGNIHSETPADLERKKMIAHVGILNIVFQTQH